MLAVSECIRKKTGLSILSMHSSSLDTKESAAMLSLLSFSISLSSCNELVLIIK